MHSTSYRDWLGVVATLCLVALVLTFGLSSFGIWDPWELRIADIARDVRNGTLASSDSPGTLWLIAKGFALFGVREWAGRLPLVLMGVVAACCAFALLYRANGVRGGIYAALVTASSPLFLFNARQMLGQSPGFAAQGLIGVGAACALFPKSQDEAPARREWVIAFGLILMAIGTVAAIAFSGALLGALPPLAAAAVVGGLRANVRRSGGRWVPLVLGGATLLLAGLVARAVFLNEAGYTAWIGAAPQGGAAPSFDGVLERVFHSFAPWSALLPLAFVGALDGVRRDRENDGDGVERTEENAVQDGDGSAFRWMLALWIAFGYAAETVFSSNYGPAAFLPIVALGSLLALALRDTEDRPRAHWPAAVVTTLMVALAVRDFALYPESPLHALAIAGAKLPESFNPRRAWAACFGLFALAAAFGLAASPNAETLDVGRPYRLLRTQWHKDLATKLWLLVFALLLAAGLVLSVIGMAAGTKLGLPTVVIRGTKIAGAAIVALPLAVVAAQVLLYGFARLGRHRLVPLMAAGVLAGIYSSQGFLPALSAHLSPREVYDAYNALAKRGEPLSEYRIGTRAAAYYARGKVSRIESPSELNTYLLASQRRWVALPADDLAAVDRTFRQSTGRHLFVADAGNARVLLATNEPPPKVEDTNPLARAVRKSVPKVEHEVHAIFDNKIELVGYDLSLPHPGYVGGGERFAVTWVFRVLQPIGGGWKIFLHVDGQGQRLNGDHEPAGDLYPVRLWERGDIIIDRQELGVPATYRSGKYTMYMGFFSGESRLPATKGPKDAENRLIAGSLMVK